MAIVARDAAGKRIARMQIKRHAEAFDDSPEWPVLRQIVIDRGVGPFDLREAVDQRAPEAEVVDTTLKLARRDLGILHSERRNTDETIRALGDFGCEHVVGA